MLRNGLLVAENLRVPKEIESGRGEFLFLALNIEGSDGSPARVVGRSIT
jgi:kynurenine formamidase